MSDHVQALADLAKARVPQGLDVDHWVMAYNQELIKLTVQACVREIQACLDHTDDPHVMEVLTQAQARIQQRFSMSNS